VSKNAKRRLREIQERRAADGAHASGLVELRGLVEQGDCADLAEWSELEVQEFVSGAGVDLDRVPEGPRKLIESMLTGSVPHDVERLRI
jgi:hypothetical protein